jgi:choline dehydrogenase-like flavoprotein
MSCPKTRPERSRHVPLGRLCRYETALFRTDVDWDYSSRYEPHWNNRRIFLPRGKVLGGSSSIDGMMYIRGNRCDYDEWAALDNRRVGATLHSVAAQNRVGVLRPACGLAGEWLGSRAPIGVSDRHTGRLALGCGRVAAALQRSEVMTPHRMPPQEVATAWWSTT